MYYLLRAFRIGLSRFTRCPGRLWPTWTISKQSLIHNWLVGVDEGVHGSLEDQFKKIFYRLNEFLIPTWCVTSLLTPHVCWSVCHDFIKGRIVTLRCSYQTTFLTFGFDGIGGSLFRNLDFLTPEMKLLQNITGHYNSTI